MSRTRKGSKGPGYDYWGGRPGGTTPGPDTKRVTHGIERARAHAEEVESLRVVVCLGCRARLAPSEMEDQYCVDCETRDTDRGLA